MPIINPDAQIPRITEALAARRPPFPDEGHLAPASHPTRSREIADLIWLPGSIDATLARRRSVRKFRRDPVPESMVEAAVTAARDAEAATWPASSHGAFRFEILVAACAVEGVARGLHATSSGAGLRPLGTYDACLRSLPALYADVPVLLLICGDLNGVCRAGGASGYASMLTRAGTIGYAAWLWAVSAGLAGSVYAAASHEVTGAARELDPNLRHLFTLALGAPAEQAQSPAGAISDHGAE
jgi:hypothetical protein